MRSACSRSFGPSAADLPSASAFSASKAMACVTLRSRGVDAFEPANLHRCYLRQDPVFLRSLLRLAGRKIDRRFYFSCLLPGTQRGRAGRRAACSYVLLRNSFSKKWGSFIQQRPLALSSVQRLQRPPRNVTVRCQDALAYLRALPRLAPRQAIYADPPYIFPGRSMNYYGTRRRGHDLAFHSELRDALFATGLPFVLSINDAPEAWELYSGAGSITRLCSGKNGSARAAGSASGQSCVWRRNG